MVNFKTQRYKITYIVIDFNFSKLGDNLFHNYTERYAHEEGIIQIFDRIEIKLPKSPSLL